MGMLIDGTWRADTDRFMQDGAFRRETSSLPSRLDDGAIAALRERPERFVLVASASCPWSHGVVLAALYKGFLGRLVLQRAGGARIEGYGLLAGGPMSGDIRHVHELYTATDTAYTGRVTVPLLWSLDTGRILSNASSEIIDALNAAGDGPDLRPASLKQDIEALLPHIYDGLSNAVYRAGLAERQDEYDTAVDTVFATMAELDTRLEDRKYLFGDHLTVADIRLFATLVRFDTVYATHFRCTRARLTDHPGLWRFTRRIFQHPGVADTVDFDEIRYGYFVNDGSHNPHGIISQQPRIDWYSQQGLTGC